jgi:EAL domain-containing protein (putative c-di-GMP-specific phosphodiesterase class I)
MPPGLFLTFIEQQGRIRELTELIITLSARAVREFRAAGRKWNVSINLSAGDISDPRLTATIKTIVGMQGLTPDVLTLEVPEHALPTPGSRDETHLRELKKLGCQMALDTGPVTPARPQTIPAKLFDELKIGGSAIIRFAHSVRKASMSALAMKLHAARSAGLTAVAVGVEDEETFKALSELGFTGAQGSFIQRALTVPALLSWDGAWLEGTPRPTQKAEIEFTATPEDIVNPVPSSFSTSSTSSVGPRSAAELIAAVEATARTSNGVRNDAPLDLDADDESDAYDDEDAEQLDEPTTRTATVTATATPRVGFGAVDEEPEGEPELGSAESAPPLTSGMIDRPKAKLVSNAPRSDAALQTSIPERWRDEPTKPQLGQTAGLKTLFGGQKAGPKR